MRSCALLLLGLTAATAETFFQETFDSTAKWTDGADKGKFTNEAGPHFGDEAAQKGLKTSEDAKFYATSAPLAKEFGNKDKDFVVSFTVQHGQGIDCGGGYLKLLPTVSAADFNGDSEYFVMFGPDICGATKKIHLIFGYNGKNLLWNKAPRAEEDKLTHLYTLVVRPDNTYEVSVDGEKKESGSLEADWDFLLPKEIEDPADLKPEDWVEEAQIADAEDTKPADWDLATETIVDAGAEKPEDWDVEDDGEWEAPTIPNPEYKGAWTQKKIANPAYKGPFVPKKIANPEYKEDKELYLASKPVGTVGIDIWQVKSGTVFDNIIISDSVEEVAAFNKVNFFAHQAAEKEAFEAASKVAADAAAAAQAEESAEEEGAEEDE